MGRPKAAISWSGTRSRSHGLRPEILAAQATTDLYRKFLESGTRARIVTVRSSRLDESFLGRDATHSGCVAEDLVLDE